VAPEPADIDRELLGRLRAGEHDAMEAIFHAHHPHLVRLAGTLLRDQAAAEDVAQDVLLELWRRREQLVVETSLRAYLMRAARNRALNTIRHRRTVTRADPAELSPTPSPTADRDLTQKEIEAALRQAVSELPERCREAFELSRVHDLTYSEIASVMNISIKSVETQIGRALRALRKRLAAWLPDASGL
jgi:RNA polymerase sigma-70 factor (ECF subfamily)